MNDFVSVPLDEVMHTTGVPPAFTDEALALRFHTPTDVRASCVTPEETRDQLS